MDKDDWLELLSIVSVFAVVLFIACNVVMGTAYFWKWITT